MTYRTYLLATALIAGTMTPLLAQQATMTFFITSAGPGNGADLGGLEGADAHCAKLAEAVGATGKTWRAYLSTNEVNARDRIGAGPWMNAKGEAIAESVDALHSDNNNLTKQTALNEKGEEVQGRGDTPNRHDILTGSDPAGMAVADKNCGGWTMSGAEGSAIVGHHDRIGLRDDAPSKSWNSSHETRGGCGQEALRGTGGDGLFYCFAAN